MITNTNGKLATDLYVKQTDKHQYFLSSSCRSKHTKMTIPCSLALRLRRNCLDNHAFKHRTEELTNYLSNRGYKHKFVTTEINKTSQIHRHIALQDTVKHRNDRVPFVVTNNPALRQIPAILHKHFPVLQSSNRCPKIFARLLMTA